MPKQFIAKLIFASLGFQYAGRQVLNGATSHAAAFEVAVAEGNELQNYGRYAAAEERYRAALHTAEAERLAPVFVAKVLTNLGSTLHQEAKYGEAETCYRKAAEQWRN